MIFNKPGLETRLNLSIGLIILITTGLSFAWTIKDARDSVQKEAKASVSLALGLIDASLTMGESGSQTIHAWLDHIAHLDQIRHLRITTGHQGVPALIQGQRQRSEYNDDVPSWFRWAVSSEPIEVVREVRLEKEGAIQIHIQSYAEDEILEAWDETKGFLSLIFLLALAIYIAVHLIASRALRPIATILDGLSSIEHGDLETPIKESGLPELDQIAQNINQLSTTLKAARDENRALTRHSHFLVEEERKSLARELHDELGQSLSLIKVSAASLKRKPQFQHEEAINVVLQTCDRLFSVVRDMMRKLRPSTLDELGLVASLEDLVDSWNSSNSELEIDLKYSLDVDEAAGSSSVDLLRMIQECIVNTVKHGNASRLDIELNVIQGAQSSWLNLKVQDDGCGFDIQAPRKGFGLKGIKERVEGLGGKLSILSPSGGGVLIEVKVPVRWSADE